MKICGITLLLIVAHFCPAISQDNNPRQVPSLPEARKQALLITISIPETTVRVGSVIHGEMLITNKSRHPLCVGRGCWGSAGLVVRNSQGIESLTDLERCIRRGGPCNTSSSPSGPCAVENQQCQTLYYIPMGGGPSFSLDPRKSHSEPVEVNQRAYDVTRPGKYTIQWEGRDTSGTVMRSNAITLTIVP